MLVHISGNNCGL